VGEEKESGSERGRDSKRERKAERRDGEAASGGYDEHFEGARAD
jgi:hypothetical protein